MGNAKKIYFRPPCKGVNGSGFLVKDELIATGVDVHIEKMSEDSFFMSILDPETRKGFDFAITVGKQKVDDGDGEMVYPVLLTATEQY